MIEEPIPFARIPLVDGHLHPPLLRDAEHPYVRYFSEAADGESLARHAPHSLFFRSAIDELAGLLGCAPEPEAVVAARAALGLPALLRLMVRDAGVETLLIDDGYPPEGAVSVEEVGVCLRQTGCATGRVLRIETLAEALFGEATSPLDWADRLERALDAAPRPRALKTIIAYRCGLQIAEPAMDAVARAFAEVQEAAGGGRPRLTSKPLLDFLLLWALDWAVAHELPVQMHTGYGDRDLDLVLANPALLRPLLEQSRFAALRLVLLHAGYPYCREAAYLAAIYPHVCVDFSQANPMLPHRELTRVLEELLALAPYTKLLYGSDAWGIPDWIWLGARAGRRALGAALDGVRGRDEIARHVLRDNARALYGL